jgi:hypothetical protein
MGQNAAESFHDDADILSLTAFVVPHFRAIHDRGIDEGLNHEQSTFVGRLLHDSSGPSTHGCLHL